jgi:Fic/DOC family protein
MQKKTDVLPEIVFTSSESAEARRISRLAKSGDLIKLAPKIYTSNPHKSPETLIHENWRKIIAHLYPGAIVSYRTAFMGGQPVDNTVFITTHITKNMLLPGLTIRLLKGEPVTEYDMPLPEDGLFMSSEARYLLENLQPARSQKTISKSIGSEKIECYIEKIIRNRGEDSINKIRDQAKKISKELDLVAEYRLLNKIIGALLSTQNEYNLQSEVGKSRAAGTPYDPNRLDLFEALFTHLRDSYIEKTPWTATEDSWRNAAFYDAYFSNYIEGTDFLIEEAKSIVFDGQLIKGRISDSHDVLGTYRVLNDHTEMFKRPNSADEFIASLKYRHHAIMGFRHDINPGEFKGINNRAGNTEFVYPELVEGTLKKGFNYYQQLDDGFQKAAFMMFIIAEVHPFIDGNGRLSRAFMNAEMLSNKQSRIIVPTVYRDDYLLTLRRLTREGDAEPYIRMLSRVSLFTAGIDFSNLTNAEKKLEVCNAFKSPNEGLLVMPG